MIHDVGVELQKRLRAHGCPFPVVDAPDPATNTFGRERVVIGYDREGNDRFSAPRGVNRNPDHRFNHAHVCKVEIYARSPKANAFGFEHEDRALRVLDLVMVGLAQVANSAPFRTIWTPLGGGFFDPPDLEESERRRGAAYALPFLFERPVGNRKWSGDAPFYTTALGANTIKSKTMVSLHGGPDDDEDPTNIPAAAVMACGEED